MPDVKLIHGDCLQVMRGMEDNSVDAVITDPPYPKLTGGHNRDFNIGGVSIRKNITKSMGDEWHASLDWIDEAIRLSKYGLIVFCSFHTVAEVKNKVGNRAKPVCLITWYKRNSPPTGKNLPRYTTEFVWCFNISPGMNWDKLETTMFDIPMLQAGCFATERILNSDGSTFHPTQKPLLLMHHLLKTDPISVLDPFMGTGTTLVSCVQTGRNGIGIEIDEKYYAIAQKRIKDALQQPGLFA